MLNFNLWENSGEGWASFARRWQQCPRLAVGSKSVSLEWLGSRRKRSPIAYIVREPQRGRRTRGAHRKERRVSGDPTQPRMIVTHKRPRDAKTRSIRSPKAWRLQTVFGPSRRSTTRYGTSSFGRTRPRRGKEMVSASGSIHYLYVYAVLAAASTILFREKGCPITQDPSVFAN